MRKCLHKGCELDAKFLWSRQSVMQGNNYDLVSEESHFECDAGHKSLNRENHTEPPMPEEWEVHEGNVVELMGGLKSPARFGT